MERRNELMVGIWTLILEGVENLKILLHKIISILTQLVKDMDKVSNYWRNKMENETLYKISRNHKHLTAKKSSQ